MIELPRDDSDARRIAEHAYKAASMRRVAEIARKAINRSASGAFNALLTHLAYAYGQGYVAGWRRARAERGESPPTPNL